MRLQRRRLRAGTAARPRGGTAGPSPDGSSGRGRMATFAPNPVLNRLLQGDAIAGSDPSGAWLSKGCSHLMQSLNATKDAVSVSRHFQMHSQDTKRDGSHSNCRSSLVLRVWFQGCEMLSFFPYM